MNLQTPTSADWSGFHRFLDQEFTKRTYVLVESNGERVSVNNLTDREAADWNVRLRDRGYKSRWMRPAEDYDFPTPPVQQRREVNHSTRYALACISVSLLFWFGFGAGALLGIGYVAEHFFGW